MIQDEIVPEEITGPGFYNKDGIWAPNFVCGPDFELFKDLKDTYTYPNNGWVWANSWIEASGILN